MLIFILFSPKYDTPLDVGWLPEVSFCFAKNASAIICHSTNTRCTKLDLSSRNTMYADPFADRSKPLMSIEVVPCMLRDGEAYSSLPSAVYTS